MCGIAGIIYRDGGGSHQVGRDMTRMLQAMKHRGPDSTGYALYRPEADGYVMHVKLAEANGHQGFEFEELLRRSRKEIEGRYKDMGYVKNITAHYRLLLDELLERRPEFGEVAARLSRVAADLATLRPRAMPMAAE